MRYALFLLLILLFSCSDNSSGTVTVDEQRKIIFTNTNQALYSYDVALNSISKIDIIKDGIKYELPGHIFYMDKFGNNLYLLIPSAKKMLIIDSENFNFIDEIEFDNMPKKIVFAENATTAYVMHMNSGVISVIDLTVNEIADEFEVINDEAFFTDIVTDGNILAISSMLDNSVYIYSNKDESLIGKIDVAPRPVNLEIMNEDRSLLVISAGNGKISDTETSSPAVAAYYDLQSVTAGNSFNIQYGSVSSNNIYPLEAVNSVNDFTLLRCENEILFINSQVRAESRLFILDSFDDIHYDISDNLVYMTKSLGNATEIYTFLPSDNKFQDRYLVQNYEISSFLVEK
jgi:hypothetical protein